MPTLDALLAAGAPPVVAILRGVNPWEAVPVSAALLEAGVRMIEVPLNSPDPFASISAIQDHFGADALVGAGTVLTVADVLKLADTGARLLVTPNTDAAVIRRGCELGLEVMPGFFTPSEAMLAVASGASRLKLFPAGPAGPAYLKAIQAVLPSSTRVWAVGDINASNAAAWHSAGVEGFGVGGSLYRPGFTPHEVLEAARNLLRTFFNASGQNDR